MSVKLKHIQDLRNIFLKSVESVRPVNLLSAGNNYCLRPQAYEDDKRQLVIRLQGKIWNLSRKRCHVVGFGKAVLGMAVQLELALKEHLVSGVLSIPSGTLSKFRHEPEMKLSKSSKIKVFEGAQNNQPDEAALQAASCIKSLAGSMGENDILFVLISGGGSALLPLPRLPVTLTEKMQLVRDLANRSASIDEMNVVRIALSDIKGGRLAALARNAFAVISFVISDIVGDPVDLIASGPTCAPLAKHNNVQEVLEKYELWAGLPVHIRKLIETSLPEEETKPGLNSSIYIVGDNRVAAATAVQEALQCGYNPFIVSTTVQGEVQELVRIYIDFLRALQSFRAEKIDEKELKKSFPFDPRNFEHFFKTLRMCERTGKPLLLIFAGEPTVKVSGYGLGGRNQELALRMCLELHANKDLANVTFLSAGTDGIDGPTPAAGAVASSSVISQFLCDNSKNLTDVHAVLQNNDSYNFFRALNGGEYHVITGHTGTNVMDLQLLLVP